jgi:RES domain-containing protein
MNAWRLTKKKYAQEAFTGKGAKDNGGRWNKEKTAVVYASEHLSLAILEILDNARQTKTDVFIAIPIIIPDEMVITINTDLLPADWRAEPFPESTQKIGEDWVAGMRSAALRVPSVFVPQEFNIVLNPKHPDFMKVKIGKPETFRMDQRLID